MVCLDTSFVIDLLLNRKKVEELKEKIDNSGDRIFVPAPVIKELIAGANLHQNKEKETEKIMNFISIVDVLPLDEEGAVIAGKIEAELIRGGNIIDAEDIMIGAIALQNDEVLVTGNLKHFERIRGLKIESY